MTHFKRFPLVSMMALGMALPAFAQTPADQAPPQSAAAAAERGSDVIIVTANKREESVQDIPVAVTAISSQKKEELGIISVTDLTNVTPGLSYTPGNERVTLRGIGRLTNSFGADPGVANYNDGIYTAFAVFAGKDPLLIDRVEVLRGPQGTLYGRNAIGGAINTISKRPTDTFQTDVVLGAGNDDYKKAGAAVSGPITDWLRYRAAGFYEYRGGIDPNYGQNGEKVGWEINDKYLELQLEGNVGDRFKWWFKTADLSYDKAGPPGGRTATFSTAPYLTNVPSAWFVAGGLTPNSAYAYTADPSIISYTQGGTRHDNPFATNGEHAYNTNLQNTAHLPAYDEYILEATYSTDWFDVKYTGGYTYYDYTLDSDPDGTPITSVTYNSIAPSAGVVAGCRSIIGFPVSISGACASLGSTPKTLHPDVLNVYEESRAFFSNELNLISTTSGPLQWIAGVYQYQENSKQPGQVQYLPDEPLANVLIDPVLGPISNPDHMLQKFSNTSLFNAYGVYGQSDYSFNDKWKATVGLRWTYDEKKSQEEGFLACYIICGLDYYNYTRTAYGPLAEYVDGQGVAHRNLKNNSSAITGMFNLEYRPVPDSLLFAKYSRGYKAGGFNNLGFAAAPYTESEYVDAYEGGWKQTWANWHLTTDAALFYYNYKDMQAPLSVITNQGQVGSTAYTAFINVPKAESKGFELETNWNPIEPLNIGLTYAYLDATVTDTGGNLYIDSSRMPGLNPVTNLNNQAVDVTGNQLAQSPKHKASLNAAYRIDMADGSYFLPTVSYSWRDIFYDSFFNSYLEKSPSYTNLDARLNWYSASGRYGLTFWVRNALDSDQTTSISSSSYRVQDGGMYQGYSFAQPRTFGVDFHFHFK
ncbi:MAG: TonB-dependent receptor [Alphaproteobacteria bacterium]|nr:TonB-dependent receptor [Alphaproteobacteria bacterium]